MKRATAHFYPKAGALSGCGAGTSLDTTEKCLRCRRAGCASRIRSQLTTVNTHNKPRPSGIRGGIRELHHPDLGKARRLAVAHDQASEADAQYERVEAGSQVPMNPKYAAWAQAVEPRFPGFWDIYLGGPDITDPTFGVGINTRFPDWGPPFDDGWSRRTAWA